MPQFEFRARDDQGQRQQGVLAAVSPSQALTELRSRGWLILDLQESLSNTPRDRAPFRFGNLLPATKFDVEIGFQQLAAMLRSGLTLLAALKTVEEQSRRPIMARVWRDVYERIQEGASVTAALRAHPRYFDTFVTQLIQIGDESGSLETVFARAAEHLERSRAHRAAMINVMIYPVIVLLFAVTVTIFMLVSIIPKMEVILRSRGRRLPALTQLLLDISVFVRVHGATLVILFVVLIVATTFFYRTPRGRSIMDRTLLGLPIFGKIIRIAGTAVLARSLGLLLQNGINLIDALQTSSFLMTNAVLRRKVEAARQGILEGSTLASGLEGSPGFELMLPRMVTVAETTGRFDTILAEVARFHEAQLTIWIRRLGAFVEPAVILVVGVIVGFVYIAFFLALMSITGGVR